MSEKNLDKILYATRNKINAANAPEEKKSSILKKIDNATDKSKKKELIRELLKKAPDSELEKADSKIKSVAAKELNKGKTPIKEDTVSTITSTTKHYELNNGPEGVVGSVKVNGDEWMSAAKAASQLSAAKFMGMVGSEAFVVGIIIGLIVGVVVPIIIKAINNAISPI